MAAFAGPMVRIRLPPAKSLQTISSAAAEAAVVNLGDDATGFVFARFFGCSRSHVSCITTAYLSSHTSSRRSKLKMLLTITI
jgi:hypothetical protein